jgi:predicted DCC family thiol-disulfide oxidoreductase YuxK
MQINNPNLTPLYVIYDGECYFCNHTAKALKIKKAVGELVLLNARESHELIDEAVRRGLDVNEGIVVYYHHAFYHGKEAINFLNKLADQSTVTSKLTHLIYKNKVMTFLGYPLLKSLRNVTLALRGTTKIQKTAFAPTFKPIFGSAWDNLPEVIKLHYANRPYSEDITRVKGTMTITFSPLMKFLAPFLSYFKIFAPAPGEHISVEVDYMSSPKNASFTFNRRFYYPHLDKPFTFKTTLWHIKDDVIIDTFRFGIGLKMRYAFDGTKVQFLHEGYALRLGKLRVPLPLTFLLGKGYGEETPLSDNSFHFFLESTHPLLGKIIRYEGMFTLCAS